MSESQDKGRFGLLQATALNMTNMIGIGPFITIPLLMTTLLGPQSMLGWLLALLVVIPDGMIWSELGRLHARLGGQLRVPPRGLRLEAVGPAHGLPLHLAVHPERAPRDRLGLHRLRPLRRVPVARNGGPWARSQRSGRDRGRGGHPERHPALPAHRLGGTAHRRALGGHAPHHRGGDREWSPALRPEGGLRFPARRLQLLRWASWWAWARPPAWASSTTWATTTSATSATKSRTRDG